MANSSRRTATTKKAAKRRLRPLKAQSLLVLHLDAPKLRADGLHFGELARMSASISATFSGASVEMVDVSTPAEFGDKLATYVQTKRTFDVVMAIGHANERGIRIAGGDGFVTWRGFAECLKPLKPRRLLLAACKGGRWTAATELFLALPQLRRIFACPVDATKDFAELMLLAVPYIVAERRPNAAIIDAAHVTSLIASGCQLREWRRSSDHGKSESAAYDLLAEFLNPLAGRVPATVDALMRSIFVARSSR